MVRMFRFTSLAGLTLAASLAGCGDMAMPPASMGDMAVPVMNDLAKGPADLTQLAVTGEACKMSTDCAPSMAPGNAKGMCTKSNMIGGNGTVMWPDGYCQASCRTAKNDANGINNTDCSGETPVCVGSGSGTCYAGCTSVNDCREMYVCANITGTPTPGCVPMQASECDPLNDPRPTNKKCMNGQRCVDYSPDNSYGGCADVCDPVAQNCPPAMSGANGCITDFQVNDGSGECINVNENNMEGAPCVFLNDCPAGMMCYGQKCRTYCRAGSSPDAGAKGCPMGQTCKDITLSGITVKFKKEVTGICAP